MVRTGQSSWPLVVKKLHPTAYQPCSSGVKTKGMLDLFMLISSMGLQSKVKKLGGCVCGGNSQMIILRATGGHKLKLGKTAF